MLTILMRGVNAASATAAAGVAVAARSNVIMMTSKALRIRCLSSAAITVMLAAAAMMKLC
jgi:hypothetical protein